MLWHRAPWGGQRPSLADYVMVTGLRLRLQRGCSVRGWGLTAWGRGLRSGGSRAVGRGGARAEGVNVVGSSGNRVGW